MDANIWRDFQIRISVTSDQITICQISFEICDVKQIYARAKK